MEELEKMLRDQRRSEKELLCLDHQVLHLATILKVPACTYAHARVHTGVFSMCLNMHAPQNNLSLLRVSEEEEETLAVEEVLGSFDFLSHDDDTSCSGSLRMKDSR